MKYRCLTCGRGFTRPNHLKVHMMVNTGEKPFSCTGTICSRQFSRKANMIRHRRGHERGKWDHKSGKQFKSKIEKSQEHKPDKTQVTLVETLR